ncbi:MAG: HPP family protein [Proteobacteria bacterium]|nr:HPP family protein [Pseudomonadota bacterium]
MSLSPSQNPGTESSPSRTRTWLRLFKPARVRINQRERWRMVLGLALCIALVALFAHWLGMASSPPWMVASLGASAVLMIALPSSPLAQPWPVLAGSVLSYLVGVACAALVPDLSVASGLAVGLAVAVMLALRCLHPPGGGMALFAVLHPHESTAAGALPVALNVLILVLAGIAFNHLTGRSYPHAQARAPSGRKESGAFTSGDLDAALSHYNQVLDVSRDDLEGLLHLAGRAAFQRTLGELRCRQIMSAPVHTVTAETPLRQAWALMRRHAIKALPVVDAHNAVIGIVTMADFMRLANLELHEGMGQRLRTLILGRPRQPEQVLGLMSAPVLQVRVEQHVMDLVPLFSDAGHHHIPVVDEAGQLAGIITQSDLVKTLAAAVAQS